MIVIKVQYTVNQSYVEKNKSNINKVMSDLRKMNNSDIQYSAYIEEDGNTFMHFATYPDEKTLKIVTELPAFKKFQTELKASDLINPPKAEYYSLVSSSINF